MELLITAFVLVYILSLIWNILTDNKWIKLFSAFILSVSPIMVFAVWMSHENINKPTAMDVYQSKTTLEITYKDSMRIDSIVVFKDEFKKAMEE